jgi:hypothetical protein
VACDAAEASETVNWPAVPDSEALGSVATIVAAGGAATGAIVTVAVLGDPMV